MFRILLLLLWTAIATASAAPAVFDADASPWRIILVIVPLIGVYLIRDAVKRHTRRRSLQMRDGIYVWVDLDGTERHAPHDPTPAWDAADGGGGDGGDGGD